MGKQYEENLLKALKKRERMEQYQGAPMLVKYLPDSDEKGAMDPRLYRDSKKNLRIMAWMPSSFLKMDTSEKGIANLRKMFNGIKSIPCVETKINIEKCQVRAEDGYEIPVRIYKKAEGQVNTKAVFYYIHGGGFFGGSPDVVEEAVKMFVEKTGLCAVSVDYRLAPEHPYPTGHKDCYRVLQWIGEDGKNLVKGQMLLYPTLNMAQVRDQYYHPGLEQYDMAPKQKKGLTKMLKMFSGMSTGLETILGTRDIRNDYLNPYTRNAADNPPTFLTVGEHDFLKMETLGYGVKLYQAGVETQMVLYKGFGHAYIDNIGVYPQSEDCIDEMAGFVLKHIE